MLKITGNDYFDGLVEAYEGAYGGTDIVPVVSVEPVTETPVEPLKVSFEREIEDGGFGIFTIHTRKYGYYLIADLYASDKPASYITKKVDALPFTLSDFEKMSDLNKFYTFMGVLAS